MIDLGDATNWTDREREFFAAGWNECLKMQPGENGRLRAALSAAEAKAQTALDAMDDNDATIHGCRDVVSICDAALVYQQNVDAGK